ncbi:MAG: histidinol phosphate phosphatase domain-containing protein [Nitrospira sp.]|nr:histidinol phosphate phosphatase domain-containing protein [bacterium]MBL7048275.1 histidinol phosphate phosphatase domain-containing protein [Nitrospira sp.]
MIDLHTHTLFSDGALLPAELIQRAKVIGYKAIALTDHMDMSNMDFIIPRIRAAIKELTGYLDITVVSGAEITHVPPGLIEKMVKRARELGAGIVVVHGETVAEPVIAGTNRAAILAQADILSHPGLISMEDAVLAAQNNVALEITARKGHSLTNGHVAKTAMAAGAALVINTDSHDPSDLITRERAETILRGAGIAKENIETIFLNSQKIVDKAGRN